MENEIQSVGLACPAQAVWTQCEAVIHPASARLRPSPAECFPVKAAAGGNIGKQMFLFWKSCSWILDCVYIPSTVECLEIGNSVPAEWAKGMRLKKNHYHHFWEACQITLFCTWFAHPADVSAQIFLLVFSSYTVCQAHPPAWRTSSVNYKWTTYCQWESMRKGMWPGAHTRALRLHSTGWARHVLVFSRQPQMFTAGDSRGFASEEQYMHSPECFCGMFPVGC